MKKVIALFFIFLTLASLPASAALLENSELTADNMRFDPATGDFIATGNVVIKADGVTVTSPLGTGNVKSRELHFTEGISAAGTWQGQQLNLKAGRISLYFAQTPTYTVEGGVKGFYGTMSIDADKFYVKGQDLSAKGVRRLEDSKNGVSFGADSAHGKVENGVITSLSAEGNVLIRGKASEPTEIRGEKALYSVARGSVVVSGNVKALQKGRTLTASALTYFPGANRIEAAGSDKGSSPARIVIDMSQGVGERKKQDKRDKK
ncbi:MAG: hypothetical protein LBR38_05965 [Synergistaceae bacterium]|nr:hypothetical protein [Synergistaceae bacterium]